MMERVKKLKAAQTQPLATSRMLQRKTTPRVRMLLRGTIVWAHVCSTAMEIKYVMNLKLGDAPILRL
jgi:hypothetical protein